MKIVIAHQLTRKFSAMKRGGIFYYDGRAFMKIDEVLSHSSGNVLNAIDMQSGHAVYFGDPVVIPFDDASLHCNGD